MKRWTSTWAAMVVAGFLAVPAISFAQGAAAPSSGGSTAQDRPASGSPQEHLQKADATLNSITSASVTGEATAKIAQLKKHVEVMGRMAAGPRPGPSDNGKSATDWASEAAAADRILGELLAAAPATGALGASSPSEPKPAGTSGVAPSRARTSVSLDDETQAKLASVRANLTAFAVAMSASAAPSRGAASSAAGATTSAPATAASPAARPMAPTASPAAAPATPATAPAPSAPTAATQAPAAAGTAATPAGQAPTQPATPPAPPDASAAAVQPPAGITVPAAPAAQASVGPEAAKRALTSARDALSQMTQSPAAAQLAGENRTQVAQLIANFNELITTSAEWKAAYAKVDANVTALIGADTSGEPATAATAQPSTAAAPAQPATAAPPANAAPDAAGTSGTTTASSLDPALKSKLVEFRTHLKAFEKAAGGVATGGVQK